MNPYEPTSTRTVAPPNTGTGAAGPAGQPLRNLSLLRQSPVPLPLGWTEAWASSLCELSRSGWQNHRLLRSGGCTGSRAQGHSGLGPGAIKLASIGNRQQRAVDSLKNPGPEAKEPLLKKPTFATAF